jgi:hypothetical protein
MLVVLSRATCRMKLRGSVRAEIRSSPPRRGAALVVPDAGGVLERQAADAPRTLIARATTENRRIAFITSPLCCTAHALLLRYDTI